MPPQEHRSPNLDQYSDSLTLREIREWRDSITTFFQEDWGTVGNIVSKLEECCWDETIDRQAEHPAEAELPKQERFEADYSVLGLPETPVSNDPEQKRRLEELAKKIEARLSHSSGAKSPQV